MASVVLATGCATKKTQPMAEIAPPFQGTNGDVVVVNRTPYTLRLTTGQAFERRQDGTRTADTDIWPKTMAVFHFSSEQTTSVFITFTAFREHLLGDQTFTSKVGWYKRKESVGAAISCKIITIRNSDL
jgi:hypothetical protein